MEATERWADGKLQVKATGIRMQTRVFGRCETLGNGGFET